MDHPPIVSAGPPGITGWITGDICQQTFFGCPEQSAVYNVDPEVIETLLICNFDHAKKHEKEERESCRLFCNELLLPSRLWY